ncbi:hypothetical protein HDU83_005791 [Entophlyctis luteolus]|nr:hypothetical protein HDU83_005791 [Entophlyctis luteolus]
MALKAVSLLRPSRPSLALTPNPSARIRPASLQSVAFAFKRGLVTHLVVSDPAWRAFKAAKGVADAVPSSYASAAKCISFARQWSIKVWSESEFKHYSSALAKPATTKSLANLCAADVLKRTASRALSTSSAGISGPNGSMGFRPLTGVYVMVEDLQQTHRPVFWREFPNTSEGSGSSSKYPVLHLEGKVGTGFSGHAFLAAEDGKCSNNSPDSNADDEEEHDRDPSSNELFDVENAAEDVPDHGRFENSNASGILNNTTTSMRPPMQDAAASTNKEYSGLMRRMLARKSSAEEAEKKPDRKPLHKSTAKTKKPTGPRGKDFYFRPGYCENCAEKFDVFIDHIATPRHQQFANDPNNFGKIDHFLTTVAREPRAEIVPVQDVLEVETNSCDSSIAPFRNGQSQQNTFSGHSADSHKDCQPELQPEFQQHGQPPTNIALLNQAANDAAENNHADRTVTNTNSADVYPTEGRKITILQTKERHGTVGWIFIVAEDAQTEVDAVVGNGDCPASEVANCLRNL